MTISALIGVALASIAVLNKRPAGEPADALTAERQGAVTTSFTEQ